VTVSAAASGGDLRAALEALRDRLAAEIDCADGRTLAPLAKQFADVVQRISQLPAEEKGSTVDDIAARRAARIRKAAGS
jgi:hypothetical protein